MRIVHLHYSVVIGTEATRRAEAVRNRQTVTAQQLGASLLDDRRRRLSALLRPGALSTLDARRAAPAHVQVAVERRRASGRVRRRRHRSHQAPLSALTTLAATWQRPLLLARQPVNRIRNDAPPLTFSSRGLRVSSIYHHTLLSTTNQLGLQ